jgi:hypothetical protein
VEKEKISMTGWSKHTANEPGSGKGSDEQGYSIPFVHCCAAFCLITFSLKGKKELHCVTL